jgi:hypothetical protein
MKIVDKYRWPTWLDNSYIVIIHIQNNYVYGIASNIWPHNHGNQIHRFSIHEGLRSYGYWIKL